MVRYIIGGVVTVVPTKMIVVYSFCKVEAAVYAHLTAITFLITIECKTECDIQCVTKVPPLLWNLSNVTYLTLMHGSPQRKVIGYPQSLYTQKLMVLLLLSHIVNGFDLVSLF